MEVPMFFICGWLNTQMKNLWIGELTKYPDREGNRTHCHYKCSAIK